jgi:hypothetical protein
VYLELDHGSINLACVPQRCQASLTAPGDSPVESQCDAFTNRPWISELLPAGCMAQRRAPLQTDHMSQLDFSWRLTSDPGYVTHSIVGSSPNLNPRTTVSGRPYNRNNGARPK